MKAIIDDSKYETEVYGYYGGSVIMIGDILLSTDVDGLPWDCEVTEIHENIASLKKLRVNEIFYNYVQTMYIKYNKSSVL